MNELSPRPRNDYVKFQINVKNNLLQHQLVRGKHLDKNTQDVNFFLPSKSPRILDFKYPQITKHFGGADLPVRKLHKKKLNGAVARFFF